MPIKAKRKLRLQKPADHPAERSSPSSARSTAPTVNVAGVAAACACLLLLALWLWAASSWRATALREAYLPQLEQQAAHDPYDGALWTLVGAREAEARDPGASQSLIAALRDGENTEQVWQTLAAVDALLGDRGRAMATLGKGRDILQGHSQAIDAALIRCQAVAQNAPPAVLASAICPDGPSGLARHYTGGSIFNSIVEWWGHLHPGESGFTTRQDWASQQPNNFQAQILWGEALLTNRRLPEAALVLNRAVTLAPSSPQALLGLAQVLQAAGRSQDAATEYLQSLKIAPNSVTALIGLGQVSTAAGLAYARPAFLKATRIAPGNADALVGLGTADTGHDQYLQECVSAFRRAVALSPERTDFFDNYADSLARTGKHAQAEVLLQKRLAAQPFDVAGHILYGSLLLQENPTKDRLAQAEAQTRDVLNASLYTTITAKQRAVVEAQLGEILLHENDVDGAVNYLQESIADDPYVAEPHSNLARAYAGRGKIQLAAQQQALASSIYNTLQTIAVLESKERFLDLDYHRRLASLYRKTGNAAKAAAQMQIVDVIQRNPAAAAKSYVDLQADVHIALGQ